jgi:hypothetical protein
MPPDLLSVGVVETSRPAPEPVFTESVPDLPLTGEDALSTDGEVKPARSARKRASGDEAKPRRARKTAAASDDEPAPRRSARKSRSKTASD